MSCIVWFGGLKVKLGQELYAQFAKTGLWRLKYVGDKSTAVPNPRYEPACNRACGLLPDLGRGRTRQRWQGVCKQGGISAGSLLEKSCLLLITSDAATRRDLGSINLEE